jgi:drug/metabolite transporter (DMT)-like permease
VDTFQAIVVNYFIAFTVGFLNYGEDWNSKAFEHTSWMPFALVIGILFISLFLLMGKSAQTNGIGTTSVTVKMSLVIPVIAAIYLYQEAVFVSKVLGVILALVGVFLITFKKKDVDKKPSNFVYLIILFLGSGLLDATLNYAEKNVLMDLSPALFSAIGFGIAAVIGTVVAIILVLTNKIKLALRNILGGIVLGIPNFYSIYFLIMAVRAPQDDSITYALNNVGIVLASFVLGIFLFHEKMTLKKGIGLLIATTAIVLFSI